MQKSKPRLSKVKLVGQVSDKGGLISELYDPNSFHDSKATLGTPQAWGVSTEAGGGVRKGSVQA